MHHCPRWQALIDYEGMGISIPGVRPEPVPPASRLKSSLVAALKFHFMVAIIRGMASVRSNQNLPGIYWGLKGKSASFIFGWHEYNADILQGMQ